MGMFSDLAELVPVPRRERKATPAKPAAPLKRPELKVVETAVKEALSTGNYAEVDVGLTKKPTEPKAPKAAVLKGTALKATQEKPEETSKVSSDPLLESLLETIAAEYSSYSVQEKIGVINALNDIINSNKR